MLLKSIWEIPPLYILDCLPMNISLVHHVRHISWKCTDCFCEWKFSTDRGKSLMNIYAWHKTFTVLFKICNWLTRQGRGNQLEILNNTVNITYFFLCPFLVHDLSPVTRLVSPVELVLCTFPGHLRSDSPPILSGVRVAQSLVLYVVFCRSLLVCF